MSAGKKLVAPARVSDGRAIEKKLIGARKPQDRVKHLLGLHWSGAKAEPIREAAAKLLSEQQSDGGWAQRRGFPSDAYATGQTLYALAQAGGIPPSNRAYQNGVTFLRNTQLEDGSWHVRSRSVKFQPYFDSGFPHEHDQWISAAGTAWATMALTLAVEPSATALCQDCR